jgi:acetylornithine deacetylase/succinyl-diaminopimelate desuccinylase-like protein
MTDQRSKAIEFSHQNRQKFLDMLIDYVKFPTVSADSAHKDDMRAAAEWTSEKLKEIGMENIQIHETGGHPLVYADHLHAGEDKPTAVIYGHYDVQPPDPLELWKTGPFEPEIRDNKLYGRGSSDMKGQIIASMSAVESILSAGELPLNIKWMIEGEEEIGSVNLPNFIENNKKLYACDFVVNPDTGILGEDIPAIPYALRGVVGFEIELIGPAMDLHSGTFGGVVLNPANELARLVAGMHNEDGKITLPSFYDQVQELSPKEKEEMAKLPIDEDSFKQTTGVPEVTGGENGYTPVERGTTRPTLDINGIFSGYTGEGMKTVLPSIATAKITCRLVPNQRPEKIIEGMQQYLEENVSPGVTWKMNTTGGAPASIVPIDSEEVKALSDAMKTIWGKQPLFFRVGGSVPIVAEMERILGVVSVLTGFGLPDDNIHSPNEKLSLETWYRGIDTLIHFIYNL